MSISLRSMVKLLLTAFSFLVSFGFCFTAAAAPHPMAASHAVSASHPAAAPHIMPAAPCRVKGLEQTLSLGPTGKMLVAEGLTVDFGKTGATTFVRRIATIYKRSGKICSLGVYVKGVTDGSGKPVDFRAIGDSGYENIIVGDGSTPMFGLHHFNLNYDIINGVNFVSGQPELFYSALGREWTLPVDRIKISLSLAPKQDALIGKAAGYVGNFGSKKHARQRQAAGQIVWDAEKFPPGQDLVVVLPLPPDAIKRGVLPDAVTEMYETSKLAFLLPAATFLMLILLWLLIGSDQRFGKAPSFTLGAPWQPPRELGPAELAAILDEDCEDRDIVTTIFDLASRGYLAIREVPNHGLTGYGTVDYEFSQPPQPVSGMLKPHEELLLNTIFTGRNKVYLSDMHGYLYDYMPLLRKQILAGLTRERYFARDPQADRDYFVTSSIFVLALGGALFAYSTLGDDTYRVASYGILVSGLLIFMASGVMPKRTRKGVAAIQQSHTFEHFIMHAKDEEIEAALEKDGTIFFKLLPYAMAIGGAEFWAHKFKNLIRSAPEWYVTLDQAEAGPDYDAFNTETFVRHLLTAAGAIAGVCAMKPVSKPGEKVSHLSSRNLP